MHKYPKPPRICLLPWRPTVIVQFHRRAHLPIVLASGGLNTPVHGALVEWSAASIDDVRHWRRCARILGEFRSVEIQARLLLVSHGVCEMVCARWSRV